MSEMYDAIEALCIDRKIKVGRLCADLGISRGIMSDLKAGRTKKLSAENISKIADYFGVSVGYLLGVEQKEKAAIDVVDDDLREYLEELRSRPEKRMLFSVTKNATKAQIEAIVKMVEEMQNDR